MILNDVIVPNARNNAPLHSAIIEFKGLNIITTLLNKGANIHAKNHHRQKPLEIAIQINNTQAALLLIRRGTLGGVDLNSLLLMATDNNNATIFKMLVDHGVKFNPFINLKISLNATISQGLRKIVKHILPYCRFLKLSDKYIPREAVIRFGPQCKECVELLEWNFTGNPDSNQDEDFVYAAVKNGYLPIVLQLLEFGIDVNMMNADTGLNLLKVTSLYQHHEFVEILLKHDACVNVKTPTSTKILNTKVHYNCNYSISSVQNTNDLRNITCLHIAILNSDPKMTKLLLRYGATIIDDPNFFNITRIAVLRNCEEIVRTFLDYGINVNSIDHRGNTLLQHCIHFDFTRKDFRYNIAKLFLEKGANINIPTSRNSLIFKAIENQHYKIAELFLENNADIQYINQHGDTLLHRAVERNFDVEFIKTLLKFILPVNSVNNKMLTPLHNACRYYFENTSKTLKSIEILLDCNANVNCTDRDLITSLHFAYNLPKPEIVTILLHNGANPDAKNNKGQTPLHIVCEQYYQFYGGILCKRSNNEAPSIIQLLLQHNTNTEAVNAKGWIPLFLACKTSHDAAIKLLLDNKVNVHCKDKWGNSVIHVITKEENEELLKYLARAQINFNSVNKRGNTPLHIAVQKKSVEMTKSLIKYGANVNILDKKKRTPLRNAMEYMFHYQRKVDNCESLFQQLRSPWDYSDYDDGYYSDNDVTFYRHHECKAKKYQKIIKILKIQVIKLKVSGLKVNRQNLNLVYNSDKNETSDDESSDKDFICEEDDPKDHEDDNKIDILQLEVECEKEINKMKAESICVNNITFYDLLTRNIHFLCRFVKNKKIRQLLESKVYDKKFPLYMDIVRSRFRDAKFRYRIVNLASKYFSLNVCHRLPDDCIDAVFSYLNIQEIKMFIRAMKPLNN